MEEWIEEQKIFLLEGARAQLVPHRGTIWGGSDFIPVERLELRQWRSVFA